MLLSDAAAYHQEALAGLRRAQTTRERYAHIEGQFVAYLRQDLGRAPTVADLTVHTVRGFLAHHEDRLGAATLNLYATILKAWSKLLAEEWPEEFPKGDPLARLRLRKSSSPRIEIFSSEQWERMLAVAKGTAQALRDHALLLFMIETGARLSELCELTIPHLELLGANRYGRARILGKGQKVRYVYFGGKCSKALHMYLHRGRASSRDPHVFLGRTGRGICPDTIQKLFNKLGTAAGVYGVRCSPHTVRHTHAVWYLRANPGQIEQLRQLMGHADLKTVLIYARLAESDIAAAYESLMDTWPMKRRQEGSR